MRGPEQLARAFHRACQATGVKYAIVGGVAVSVWGQPRATEDVDVLLIYDGTVIESLQAALADEDLVVETYDLRMALRDGSHVTVHAEVPGFRIDVKPALKPEERAEVEAAVEITLDSGPLRVIRPEETLAFKVAYGSPKDLQDARSILVRQAGTLDEQRLRDLAQKLGIQEALAALREDLALDG